MNRSIFQIVGTQFGMVAFTYKDNLNYVSPSKLNMICVQQHADRAVVLLGIDMFSNGARRAQAFNFATMNEAVAFSDAIAAACGEFGTAYADNDDFYFIKKSAISMIRVEDRVDHALALIGIEGTTIQRLEFETTEDAERFITAIMTD